MDPVENLHSDEDMDDDDGDELYDVNKETDMGEPEDQAYDEFQHKLDEFERIAETTPPIDDNVVTEVVGDSHCETQMQRQVKNTGGGGGVKPPVNRRSRGANKAFKKPGVPMVLEFDELGQPTGQWRDKFSSQVGILTRKIPITLEFVDIPHGCFKHFGTILW
ncbi:uncharacterized protein LOC110684719 [Chenopodium quinoa]|uniref:uncharacterized protein LOC110684719 n=1 Tax=Chenopodium quinoa TaxID=63459 RepID=UPI000B7767CD|nr:uncharacterized protein LOC110684719 [Chenopodium quinoa]